MASDDFEKTLPPSERKLSKAKEEGNGLKLNDLMFLGSFLISTAGLFFIYDDVLEQLSLFKEFRNFWSFEKGVEFGKVFVLFASILGISLIPIALSAIVMSIAGWLLGGQIFSAKAVSFDLERINLVTKIGSLFKFGLSTIGWPLLKGLSMVALTLFCSFMVFAKLGSGTVQSHWEILKILGYIAVLFTLFAGVDSFIQWWKRNQELMMSLQEMKDEMKETDGNPFIKSRQRSIARERSRARMMSAVATSDVVVVNPEHFLVALKWDKNKDSAPRVVAKGKNDIALLLKQKAKDSGIPILEMPPLARSLWHNIKLEHMIHERYYKAIALVFAWLTQLEQGNKSFQLKEKDLMEGLESA